MTTKPTVALIADPPLLLEALAMIFRQQFPHVHLLVCRRGSDALCFASAPDQSIHLAIVNDNLPDIPGPLLLQRLRWYSPRMQSLTLPMQSARGRGPAQTVPGGGAIGNWLDAVRAALPAAEAERLPVGASMRSAMSGGVDGGSMAAAPRVEPPLQFQRLTPRQREVLSLLAQGWRNSTIAAHLHTSEKTVKAHVSAVFQVLDVSNRTQATLVAQRNGLVMASSI